MDIFEFAIQMERDGEQFYRDIASKTAHKGLRSIVAGLADDEQKHAEVVRNVRSQTPRMKPTAILDTAKNVFVRMREFGEAFEVSGDEEKLYRRAMEIEDKSIGFYLDRADQAETAEQRAVFEQLAEEENKHYRVVENLADFAARPKTYLADAEFSNLEEL